MSDYFFKHGLIISGVFDQETRFDRSSSLGLVLTICFTKHDIKSTTLSN